VGDAELLAAFRASLETLGAHQSPLGLIPLNVHPGTGEISTENAGAVDANLWYILGHYYHYLRSGDLDYLRANWPRLQQALTWLRYQDMNECGLLEVPEAGDWMDLLAVRYNVLSDNVLYGAALRAAASMADRCGTGAGHYPCAADGVWERLNLLLWVDRCWVPAHFAEHLERLKEIRLEWFMLYHNVGTISSRPFYLPYVAFREYGDYCDTLGNLLAVLCGVADAHRADHILRYLYQVGGAQPYPTKAIYPPIHPGDPDWREYYRSRNLNLPHQYHNGGIWPFIGGFHIAALVKMGWYQEARNLLNDLAAANRLGVREEWEFNEWLHGETGHPMGYPLQAWSAGMYLYAYHAVTTGETPLFDALGAEKGGEKANTALGT
jgi:GH15 family glucan-1,4-alpha-glucosidase